MTTKKQTISVRLDPEAKRRVERAAKIVRQSSGAFMEKAGESRASKVLLDWATDRYRRGEASYSELAASTGLAVEEIMTAMNAGNGDEALDMFLTSCRAVSESTSNPEFLRLGRNAVKLVKAAGTQARD